MATACDMPGLEGLYSALSRACVVCAVPAQYKPIAVRHTSRSSESYSQRPAGPMISPVSNLLQLVWLAIWQAFKTNMHAIAWSQHCPCCCRSQEDLHAHCCCCMCGVTWIFLPVALRFVLPDRWLQLMVAAWQLIMT